MITSIRWWDLSALGATVTFADGTRREFQQVPPDIYEALNGLYDTLVTATDREGWKCATGAFSRFVWRRSEAERGDAWLYR